MTTTTTIPHPLTGSPVREVATEAYRQTMANGGATVSLTGANPARYMVSLPDAEHVISAVTFTPSAVAAYVTEHAERLSEPATFLGTWMNGSSVFLDLSRSYDSLTDATRAGIEAHQVAIYDLVNESEIRLPMWEGYEN